MNKKYCVLTSRVETTMKVPSIFSTYGKAHEQMRKEFNKCLKELKEQGKEIEYKYIDSDSADIESDEYFEWRIDVCSVDDDEIIEK